MAVDTFLGKRYTIEQCTASNIAEDYNVVSDTVSDVPKDVFIERMKKAVEEGTAYRLTESSCFMYYINVGNKEGEGVCLHCKTNPIGLMILFKHIFTQVDLDTKKILVAPHSINNMLEYKSMFVKSTIRRWFLYGTPLVIRIDHLYNKFEKIYNKYKGDKL